MKSRLERVVRQTLDDRFASDADLAAAIVAAVLEELQLTEEIGYTLPDDDGSPETGQPDAWFSACDIRDGADEIATKLNDGRALFRRHVTPWVRAEEQR